MFRIVSLDKPHVVTLQKTRFSKLVIKSVHITFGRNKMDIRDFFLIKIRNFGDTL